MSDGDQAAGAGAGAGSAGAGAGAALQPANLSEAVVRILNNQQALMTKMSQQLAATQQAVQKLSRNEVVLDSLSSNMAEFVYDKEAGHTFDAWYARYTELFDKDAGALDDAAKVRLLLRKMSPQHHERYQSFILPKAARAYTFAETIDKLKALFGATVSTFRRRYNCLQTTKEDGEDYLAYSCKVNKSCVDFKLTQLTEEQFKCLIFVCGLKSNHDAEIRMRLINKLNEGADLTLQQVVEQCNSLVNLKQDTVLVEHPSNINYVAHNQRSSKPRSGSNDRDHGELPPAPCWACGRMHFIKECEFRDHKCRECGKIGHREGYCNCFSSKSSADSKASAKKKQREQSTKMVVVNKVDEGRKYVGVRINNVPLRLQLDTGSDVSIIAHRSWIRIGRPLVKPATCRARTASGGSLKLVSELHCNVTLNDVTKGGKFFVAAPGVNLDILGIDMIELFGLWNQPITAFCNKITTPKTQGKAELQASLPDVFIDKLGLCNKTPVQPVLKSTPKPAFRPERLPPEDILYQFARSSRGIISPPGIFQQKLDAVLSELNCTTGFLDDILVGGRTLKNQLRNLQLALERLQDHGYTKISAGGETLDEAAGTILHCYCSTPCSSALGGKVPAKYLVGRPDRTFLEMLCPPTPSSHTWSWEAEPVIERTGKVMFNIWLPSQQDFIRPHCNQLRTRHEAEGNADAAEAAVDSKTPLAIVLDKWGLNNTATPVPEVDGLSA